MRAVELTPDALTAIRRHARATYPLECCGFLIATPDPTDPDSPRRIVEAEPASNQDTGDRRRRFVIRPAELRAAESRREGSGHVVAGFYHSHPDHPARPSLFDQEHAWPWYSYLVVGVTGRSESSVAAFELDPDSRMFREVALTTAASDEVKDTESLSAVVPKEG